MANLSFIEKELLEKVFQMGGGYVLDFSNRTFQTFINDVLGFDVYKRFEYQSKANLLRLIFSQETDTYVGKVILELLKYKKTFLSIKDDEIESFNEAVSIGKRLLGKTIVKSKNEINKTKAEIDYKQIKKLLFDIESIENAQKKGYEFEKYLNYLFEVFGLKPRNSFKINGEQIDGSFDFENEIYLVEAKWHKNNIGVDDLRIFTDKIEQKSHFTRGVFISFSRCNDYVYQRYTNNQARFIIIYVEELFIMCEQEINFNSLFKNKLRALAEEGKIFKHIMEII